MVRPLRLAQPLRARRIPQARGRTHPARFASSTPGGGTEAAQKKAQDALASAQKFAGQAVETGKQYLGPVGERFGNLLGGTFPLIAVSPTTTLSGSGRARLPLFTLPFSLYAQDTNNRWCTTSLSRASSSSKYMSPNACNPRPPSRPSPMRTTTSGPDSGILHTGENSVKAAIGPRSAYTQWRHMVYLR